MRLVFLLLCWVQGVYALALSSTIDPLIQRLEPHTSLGMIVRRADTGKVLYQYRPNQVQVPASTLKLITGAAALLALGKEYHFTTTLQGMGKVKNGVVSGPVVLRFSSDPTLTVEDLRALLSTLTARGIHKIPQGIWLAPGVFLNDPYPPGWMSEDQVECYGAPQSSVIINQNCVQVHVVRHAQSWHILPDQLSGLIQVHNALDKGSKHECNWYQRILGPNHYLLGGCMSHDQWVGLAVTDVPLYAKTVVHQLLLSLGIEAKVHWGHPRSFKSQWHSAHQSLPLSAILKTMMKESNNMIANALFLKVGALTPGPLTWARSAENVHQLLAKKFSLPLKGMSWVEGSGASRYNLLSANHLSDFLRVIYRKKIAKEYWALLPIFGVDGTLTHRLVHSQVVGHAIAKTGSLHEVSSLAGLIHTAHRHDVLVVMLMQGQDAKHFRLVQDKIVQAIYKQG